ncbi:rhomboid family intramembrane serine protease [Marinomonas balearica]|uniref:GlpG protein n=1 Tax=Marinomonas balearica TaxID=491947 RepID=A0A4R6M646_9GAMM|nr:rhomboid family intramembrane serine protease [Marinomonas balearica]TDO96837.1 GlpG protein [Marinomonas balearica]
MYLVYTFETNEDPSELTKALWRVKIGHQVVTKTSGDELWVTDPKYVQATLELVTIWKQDALALTQVTVNRPTNSRQSIKTLVIETPVSCLFLLCTLAVCFLTQLGDNSEAVKWFLISPIFSQSGQLFSLPLLRVLESGEVWRLITPTFLHFSILHLVFNGLWVWDIGRKLERLIGSVTWLIGALVISIGANVLQYLLSNTVYFGGLSGLVYGLIGVAWLLPYILKNTPQIVSKRLFVFFMVWLGIGFTPLTESVGLGAIANTAHIVGLLLGLVLGFLYGVISKRLSNV